MPVPWILRAFFTTKSFGKLPYGTAEEGGGGGTSDLRRKIKGKESPASA